ncbi:hypothetical protein Ait01nite_055290 [Actinoplanes italicus]|uniref:Uncharacterized protein n=1 Tax=Actinoplanes italicus TaxID=113567 RepID=A0A2T0K7D1_9ACTN|nr:hypothetical protein [Actinoplanes italicus]PRX18938.1 hypothetical protein CLV67_11185 [Actinoplanes italicus]GIE32484.1 hypothetical protein Ait01nite_055290 [Actinoplanes italicus]
MAATSNPGVTVLDRGLRLSLLARSGSDASFLQLIDRALETELTGDDTVRRLPQILHLSLLRAALTGTAAPPRAAPFSPEGSPSPGTEHEPYLRELRARWTDHAGRHLYSTPAAWLHALLPPAPLPGNPHSLARLLRVFVTHLAPADCRAATSLAALIEDSGEAAVAQCALVQVALAAHDLDAEAQAWSRQRQLLTRMPAWSWPGGHTGHDRDVLAYLRPDHRARFDTAIGVLPFATGLGHALLTCLPALNDIYRDAYACHGSLEYTEHRLAGHRPAQAAAIVHEETRRNPAGSPHVPGLPPAPPIVAAIVSADEQVLGGPELRIDDPVYRLYARISARTTRARRLGADDLTPEPAPADLDPKRLPAYAEMVRLNADSPIVAALAGRVRAEAAARNDHEALLILADAGYADPDQVLDSLDTPADLESPTAGEGPTGSDSPPAGDGPAKPYPEWSALLFRHRPAEAVRRLSEAASQDWTIAAAMLEHAAAELLAAAGPRIAHDLHEAVVQAFVCATPPGTDPPAVVDGTHV